MLLCQSCLGFGSWCSALSDHIIRVCLHAMHVHQLLMIAAQNGNTEGIKMLLRCGVDVNAVNVRNPLPLHMSACDVLLDVM